MQSTQTVGTYFKTMNILHYAICFGLVFILAGARVFVKQNSTNPNFPSEQVLEIIGIVVGAIGVIVARFIFFKKTKEALALFTLGEKLTIFRFAHLIQISILEGVAFLNIVFYFLTHNDLHFFIAVGVALMLLFRRPQRQLAAMLLFSGLEDKQIVYDDAIPI